jgi:hypothetical protein
VSARTSLAFGRALQPQYHLEHAEVIVALDADLLATGPGCQRYARAFASKRQVRDTSASMNRLYVVESTPSLTGTMADHRLPLRASAIANFSHALAAAAGAVPPHVGSPSLATTVARGAQPRSATTSWRQPGGSGSHSHRRCTPWRTP